MHEDNNFMIILPSVEYLQTIKPIQDEIFPVIMIKKFTESSLIDSFYILTSILSYSIY